MGGSETLLGRLLADRRERLVLATKYTLTTRPGDPNASGNHRTNMVRSVEASLKRLGTDHIDLLYLHMWDFRTPVEEILRAFDDLVRQGKILYAGLSDTPAWQCARMQAIADLRGWSPFVALQISYSLIERTVERDLIPMAREMGMGVIPWSPLGGGVLSGKYTLQDLRGGQPGELASRRAINAATGRLSRA
jgi:aryl-alcohol dehydrogenase-like predicted oxidoreductase